jgi:acetylornithine deacetylase
MNMKVHIDELEVVKKLQELIRIPSVTGNELELATFLAQELRSLGAETVNLQTGNDFRANLIASFPGKSPGQILLFAHLDTVDVEGFREFWSLNSGTDPRINPFSGVEIDGHIWGRGSGDVKGGIATVLCALRAMKNNAIDLEKTVIVAFVSDEESGIVGKGISAGMKSALPEIIKLTSDPKLAIYLEPTNLNIYIAQIGFQILDIKVTGKTSYFGTPELGVDALKIGNRILEALWDYGEILKTRSEHQLLGNPNLLVTSFRSGGLIAVPGICEITLIRKVLPGESMDVAGQELQEILNSIAVPEGAVVEVVFTASRDHKFGGSPIESEQTTEIKVLQNILNTYQPNRCEFQGAPYWSEAPLIAEALDIDCVYWAAGDISNCHTPEERIGLQDYMHAVATLAEYLGTSWQ